ncbi:MAG: hypothetical protein HY332_20495 [Chloroflexi bacterium]|nr:hypothetical protein [Chloroflexota bacterium]
MDNRDCVRRALDLVRDGLHRFVEDGLAGQARPTGWTPGQPPDTQAVLKAVLEHWSAVFRDALGPFGRSLVHELLDARNRWAHERAFDFDDTYRTLDSAQRLLRLIDATEQANAISREKEAYWRARCEAVTQGPVAVNATNLQELAEEAPPVALPNTRTSTPLSETLIVSQPRPPVREMLWQAIHALGGQATSAALKAWVLQRYPGTNLGTISAQIGMCTVNSPSRVHLPQNAAPRVANDPRYDFLNRTERGVVEWYEPARHGQWAVTRHGSGQLAVIRLEPVDAASQGATVDLSTAPAAAVTGSMAERDAEVAPVPSTRTRRTRERVQQRVQELCRHFEHYVQLYDERVPFNRSGQYEWHRRTIERRRRLGSVAAAVNDAEFTKDLWYTLAAWGMNVRRARLVPLAELRQGLQANLHRLVALERLHLEEQPPARVLALANDVWELIAALPVTQSQSKIVGATKALHHVLPDLVPPMDRSYTQVFFHWDAVQFQRRQHDVFVDMFSYLANVAGAVRPSRYVGTGWRTSATKLLDNAIVAYCLEHERPD